MVTYKSISFLMQEVVTSLKALHRYIDYSQLSPALEGTFLYSHRNWLHLHQVSFFRKPYKSQDINF